MSDDIDLPWLPTFKLRWLRRQPEFIRDAKSLPPPVTVALQQLYRNTDNGMTEWRDVAIVDEVEDLLTSRNATVETSRRRE